MFSRISTASIVRVFLIGAILCAGAPSYALDTNQGLQDKKRALAQDFVARLKGKFAAQPAVPELPISKEQRKKDAVARIAEGEELQFRPRSGKYSFDYNIYSVRSGDDFYLSLSELLGTLGFAIQVSDAEQRAEGWYLREDWPFLIDIKSGTVTARNQNYTLAESDYKIIHDEMFIAGQSITKWMGLELEYDPEQQYVEIKSPYPLPAIAALERQNRKKNKYDYNNAAQYPRQDYDYDMFSVAAADTSLQTRYRRDGEDGNASTDTRLNTLIYGQALKHDGYVFFSEDAKEGLTAANFRLYKDSDTPDLLGPLGARSYSLGDVTTVSVPLTGSASQELGFHVSSNPLSGLSFQNTNITGNGIPGWDVELYRGGTLLELQRIDDTGRYEFTNVQLFAGDNEFEILFYGTQGEVRRENLSLPLNAETLEAQANTYDVSFSLNQKSTYVKYEPNDEDLGTARIAGQYNFYVGDALAYAGLNAVQEEGDQKLYLATGATAIIGGALFNASVAADESGESAGYVGVKKDINDWDVVLSARKQTDDFTPSGEAATTTQLTGVVSKTYTPFVGNAGNMVASAQYSEYADDSSKNSLGLTLSQSLGRISVTSGTQYEDLQTPTLSQERIVNTLSARGRVARDLTARAGLVYESKPVSRMDQYFAQLNYRPNNKYNYDLEVEHRPEEKYTEGELKMNYLHDNFRLSPFLRLNSDNDFSAGFNISTNIVNTPGPGMPDFYGERVAGQGMISANVYLDKNGNSIKDDGDDALPEVVVETINSRRREQTDDMGHAMINRLSTYIPTDVRVDQSSLPDPFMIQVGPRVSVLPRAGKIFEMDFPIQFAGEIDGTVFIDDKVAKFAEVVLIPFDGNAAAALKVKAAQDGFYLQTMVPPGQYYLTIDGDDAQTLKSARPVPQIVSILHDGTVIYGRDIVLRAHSRDTGFTVLQAGEAERLRQQYPQFAGMTEPVYLIRTDDPSVSGILQKIYNLRLKGVLNAATAGLYAMAVIDDKGAVMHTYYRAAGLDDAYNRCALITARDLPCAIDVVPVSNQPMASTPPPDPSSLGAIITDKKKPG